MKVHCGTYSLVDDALYWWKGLFFTLTPELQVSWEMFREKFYEKYYPEDTRDQLEIQFLTLRQGDRSVVEYEREFDRLSKFATKHVTDPESKRKRFIVGLRAELRGQVRALQPGTYADALTTALALDIGDSEKKASEI